MNKKYEINSREELTAHQKLISQQQGIYVRDGMSMSDARKRAAEDIAKAIDSELTGFDVESAIGSANNKFNPPSYNRHPKKQINPVLKPEKAEKKSLISLYKSWCEVNNHVTSDLEIAHFCQVTRAAVGHGRAAMIDAGYKFETNGTGFNIISPPPPPPPAKPEKTYTETEVRSMMEELLKKLGKEG
jgi:hypothetical protein